MIVEAAQLRPTASNLPRSDLSGIPRHGVGFEDGSRPGFGGPKPTEAESGDSWVRRSRPPLPESSASQAVCSTPFCRDSCRSGIGSRWTVIPTGSPRWAPFWRPGCLSFARSSSFLERMTARRPNWSSISPSLAAPTGTSDRCTRPIREPRRNPWLATAEMNREPSRLHASMRRCTCWNPFTTRFRMP